jgi:hypothetical protein
MLKIFSNKIFQVLLRTTAETISHFWRQYLCATCCE